MEEAQKPSESRVPVQLQPYVWKKGEPTANPGGRPKGIAALIRESDKAQGNELIAGLWRIAKGKDKSYGPRERLRAREILLERGYGRLPETVLNGELDASQVDGRLAELSDEQLEDLLKIAS